MNIWLVIAGMALVTYGTRLLPLTVIDNDALPLWARRGLRYVPIAVLSAIIGPAYIPHSEWETLVIDERLFAGLFAIAIAYWTQNTIITIAVGLLALLVLQAI